MSAAEAVGPAAGKKPVLVLLGVPGSGVSTTARAVADELGVSVHDTDALIEQELGATVPELVVDLGEERFRATESQIAARVLREPGVVALGSGALAAVADDLEGLRVRGVPVVHLRITPAAAMRRLGLSGLGSVSLPNPRAMWTTMAAERDATFAAAAIVSIDTTSMTEEQVAAAVLEAVRAQSG